VTLLLDTHALLWFLKNDPQLSAAAKGAIEDAANRKLVSIASCWEIAIKAGLGKLKLDEPAGVLLDREIPRNNLELLSISLEHATAVETLPAHHKDPFDRLLIAQAIAENVPVVCADPQFDAYGVRRVW
jgi:PIN domain nuclease of toxin-antitoxin system